MKKTRILAVLGVALLLSLAANVYFGGMHLGRWASAAPCDRKEWREKEALLQERLSPADYEIVTRHKHEKKKLFRVDRENLQRARAAVDAAMRADSFDPAALDAALEAERKVKLEMLQRMRAGRDSLSQELSPAGRASFDEVMRSFRPPHTPPMP